MRGLTTTAITVLCAIALCASAARSASSPPPAEFAGVSLGTSLRDLKQHYPELARNPDSDRQFQVYQALSLKGMNPKSPVAFDIVKGRVVGGQMMLDSDGTRYWYDRMVAQYGDPDSCSYCGDAYLVTASWMWGNGVRLRISGGMLTLLTEQGATARHDWIDRGDSSVSADNGDEESDMGEQPKPVVAHKKKLKKKTVPPPALAYKPPPGWRAYYEDAKTRVARWFGWSQ